MALELICDAIIESNKKINIPRCANIYRINSADKKISFYHSNPGNEDRELSTWKIPIGAREVEFTIYREHNQSILQSPAFYDPKGNLLKMGNR
jgi:hypothetical protein